MSQPQPYIIDTTVDGAALIQFQQYQNPIKVGTNRYTVTQQAFGLVQMYKSTDSGATWSAVDAVHAPNPGIDLGSNLVGTNYVGGNLIYVATLGNSATVARPLCLYTFDTNTDLWALVSSAGPTLDNATNDFLTLIRFAGSGNQMVIYTKKNPQWQTWFSIWDGATWSSPTEIAIGDSGDTRARNYAYDPATETIHLIMDQFSNGNTFYCRISNVGVVSTLYDTGNYNDRNIAYGYGVIDSDRGLVRFPQSTPNTQDGMLDISLSGVPSFNFQLVTTTTETNGARALLLADGRTVFFWTEPDNPPNSVIWYSVQDSGSSTWDTPVILWDITTTPLIPPPSVDTINAFLNLVLLDSSTMAIELSSLKTVSGLGDICAIAYYLEFPVPSPPPPTISIACPIAPLTATVGVPYVSDAPIVSGDTPPDTFELVSDPSWMLIDVHTGVVYGTPDVAGNVDYEIKVTDSLGNTATVAAPCPLTVSPAGAGSPCENVTPQPATDVQFKLIKVMATMLPAKRLPTRGSVT